MQLFLPQTDLRDAVECAVIVQRAAGSTSCFPAMPRAMLTVALAGDSLTTVGFHAMATRAAVHVHNEPLHALGLVLQPHTAARVLGISTGALVDATLPWAELAGASEAARLDHALQQARSDAVRLQALQSSLRRVLARGPERVQRARADSLQQLCWAVGHQGVQAARILGLGERQLERRCRAVLGMTPKQMQRITRWHGLLSGVLHRQQLPDAGAALASGYYDQSHLARESRQLSGTTMRELLRQAHDGTAWWALEAPRLQDRLQS